MAEIYLLGKKIEWNAMEIDTMEYFRDRFSNFGVTQNSEPIGGNDS